MDRKRITIAILALGGQGGGVLADWIIATSIANGYRAQGTSVPGVAQRTGTTVYYIELFPAGGPEPVLALTPVAGDVDIVIASELMEAGRAILRGFVSDRTVLITSTHRIYAISEKSVPGDGRRSSDKILKAASERSARFIGFDMDAATTSAGSMISAVMFGALAGSGALPFSVAAFEAAIRSGGKALAPNLKGFTAGIMAVKIPPTLPVTSSAPLPAPTSALGLALAARVSAEIPQPARRIAIEGVRRLAEYQDGGYAALYLDRLAVIAAIDDGTAAHRLTTETARYLALWMSYEDIIRVADLKTRGSRFDRVRKETSAAGQIVSITEYMHPRLEEICDALPVRLGAALLASPRSRRLLAPLFGKGRHITTSGVRWFAALHILASARRFRPASLRFGQEQARITDWLALLATTAAHNAEAACELAECPRLIKGYGDTYARGLASYERIVAWFRVHAGDADVAFRLRALRETAMADEKASTLDAAFAQAG